MRRHTNYYTICINEYIQQRYFNGTNDQREYWKRFLVPICHHWSTVSLYYRAILHVFRLSIRNSDPTKVHSNVETNVPKTVSYYPNKKSIRIIEQVQMNSAFVFNASLLE